MSGSTYSPLVLCAEIAARHSGVLSIEHALECGLSRDAIQRLVASGRWHRVRPSILQLWRPTDGDAWRQRLSAAALWLGDRASVSHRAAATLKGLDGVTGPPLEFSTNGRRRTDEAGLVIHRLALDPRDIELHDNFRVTTVARTLVDLAGVVGAETVEIALESALRGRLVTLDDVWSALRRSGGTHKGRGLVRNLLDHHPGRPAESALEVKLWRVLVDGGLPEPVRQYVVRSSGRFVARVDFAYPDAKLAIEAEGYRFHSSAPDWHRDRQRQKTMMRLGWTILRVTWDDTVRDPRRVIADVSALLARAMTVAPR